MWFSENNQRVGKRLHGGHYDHNLPIEGLDGSVLREKLLPGGVSVAQDASVERVACLVLASFPAQKSIFNFQLYERHIQATVEKISLMQRQTRTVETMEDN